MDRYLGFAQGGKLLAFLKINLIRMLLLRSYPDVNVAG